MRQPLKTLLLAATLAVTGCGASSDIESTEEAPVGIADLSPVAGLQEPGASDGGSRPDSFVQNVKEVRGGVPPELSLDSIAGLILTLLRQLGFDLPPEIQTGVVTVLTSERSQLRPAAGTPANPLPPRPTFVPSTALADSEPPPPLPASLQGRRPRSPPPDSFKLPERPAALMEAP